MKAHQQGGTKVYVVAAKGTEWQKAAAPDGSVLFKGNQQRPKEFVKKEACKNICDDDMIFY